MTNDHNPVGENWVYAPAPPDTRTFEELGDFTVDGETFRLRKYEDGSTHYDWISGPNEGYGFSESGSGAAPSRDEHIASIRNFLAEIDPETGYL